MTGVCRGAGAAPVQSAFGTGNWRSKDMLMSDVKCTGHESNLLACPYTADGSCSILEAASIVCKMNMGNYVNTRLLHIVSNSIIVLTFSDCEYCTSNIKGKQPKCRNCIPKGQNQQGTKFEL